MTYKRSPELMINCYCLLHYVLQLRNNNYVTIILNESNLMLLAINKLYISTKINIINSSSIYIFLYNIFLRVTLYVIYSKNVPLFYHFYWMRVFYPNKLNRMILGWKQPYGHTSGSSLFSSSSSSLNPITFSLVPVFGVSSISVSSFSRFSVE